ncbi:lysophospholipid acyltransferase family protein [Pseudoxanthomonas indica]|uniref:Acyltransferase n=1 Tax=Pseudoxanthomonas indica TaxID=428993 RepID=A0A1T5JQJ9_9GAMM|nr:lysophospholipid acyltransferase family protein [Pseudoxanthomonas indica]GGD43774.1 1-acyl-sn-glycerol-3-phosphate acyltransferase [Pseudoxanthomonas indica]SKC53717.1 Acyltransferase [Pseudoxanthomonas indica]
MLARSLATLAHVFIGAYPRWQGSRPEPRQRVYFANHTSHVDTVALWAALPPPLRARTRPVAARDYWGHGPRNVLARRAFNAVLIERDRDKVEGDPLQPLYDALDAGDSLIIFPEGTRNAEILPQPFKSGLFHLARRYPQVEFIAVYLDNARRCLPKGSLMPVPLICTVRFGAPVTLAVDEEKESFLQRARDAVVALA